MNNFAKFQLDFLIFFHKFNLSVAMATNQIERLD